MATEITLADGEISSADVMKYLETGGSFSVRQIVEDPEAVSARINARILEASSPEELFGESKTIKGHEYLGKPFQLLEVEWRASELDGEGLPFYGVFRICDLEGEIHVLTIGAKSVLLKAAKAASSGWLPLWLKIVQAEKKTASGYYPLDLVAAPQESKF